MSKSTDFLQITRDVALSKKFPSPKIILDGGHDMTNLLTHLGPFNICKYLSNFSDLTNGLAIILKSPMMMDISTATPKDKTKMGTGITNIEVNTRYKAKLSHKSIPPTNAGITGSLRTRLCMPDNNCKVRYRLKDEKLLCRILSQFLQEFSCISYFLNILATNLNNFMQRF